MISVGSRDGRKGTSLGLDMEETELEEGEALSYHEENEDSTIDPDIALSYIEEKLQSVLGHFQKDFEGGVSAENLGAKFGGYGSFLPTYQRSPSWSHTRSPAEVRNYDSPRSPRKLHTEDQRQTLFASSSASPSARSHTTSGKPVSVGHSLKGNGYLQSRHADEASLKSGANKKSVNDQRTLKVRIKVGSENLPTQKNSEIYSGLGLVVSPSSSLDESPTTSDGQCGKLLDVPEESPTSILQIMTSFTSELLLSPLSEDLIHLPGKRNTGGKCETKLDKTSRSSGVLVNGSLSNRSSQKVLEKKKLMSNEKDNDVFVDSIYQKNNNNMDSIVSPLKKEKEMDIDVFGCEELVSNALKLPLLSTSQHIVANPEKDKSTATTFLKDGLKGETFSPFIEKEHLESEAARSFGRVEKLGGRLSSSTKASESKEVNIVSLIAAFPQEDAPKAERSHALDQPESNASKGIKSLSAAESSDPLKQIVVQKGGSVTEEGLESVLEKSSNGGKRKQKVSHSKVSEGAQMAKDELMVESSLTPKSGKNSHSNNGYIPKSESLDLHKDRERPGDRYKEFFGDLEFEDDDNESISGEMTSSGKLKYPQPGGKRSSGKDHSTSKEKQMSRNSERLLPQENYPRPPSHLAAPHENGQGSEAPMGMIPLVKEDWVECDKCKQWRLLPLGTNPKSLPDKWLCRMLTWLTGMNRCSVPEEETTNALRALYHPVPSVPAPTSMNLNIQPYNSTVIPVGMGSFDGRRHHQEHQNLVPSATISGKKKHGSAKVANSADLDGSTHSSNSRMKNLGASGKLSKLNSRDNSPSVDASGDERMRKLSTAFEKCNDAETEKISLVSSSGKGASVKMKNKREPDMEGSRSSKRMKSEEFHVDDENWASDNCGPSSKTGRRSSSLSNNTSGNDRRKSDIHKDLNGEAKKNALSSMNAEVHFPCTSGDGLPFPGKCDDEDSRKRKEKEHHSSRINTEPVSNSGRHHLHSGDFTEELLDCDLRKEKKARVSKSGGKPTSGSKANVGTERKGRSNKDQHDGQYVKNSLAVDYQKSDMGSVPPSVAANSSSSKVSGSHRNKTNGQEGKASPVESVSSSPLRFPNADKVSSRKNLDGDDDFHDSGSLTAVNPRRLSGGDDGVDGFTGLVKKDAVNGHANDVYNDQLCQSNQYATAEEKTNNDQSQYSGSHSKKSGKGLSSHSKEKASASGYLDKVNIKASDSRNDSMNHVHLHDEKSKSRRNKSDEKFSTPTKGEMLVSKKDTAAGTSSEGSKGRSQKKFVHDGKDANRTQDKKHDLQEEHDNEKLPKKSNQTEVHGNGKSHSLPPLARVQTETGVPPVSGSQKENGVKGLAVDAYDNGDALKAPHQKKKSDSLNGQPLRHPTPNSHKVRDVEAPSPLRRDSTSHAANNALKEAKDLKHMADRLKNSGSTESNGLYFQAALKFLYGASLLESGSSEATKHNDLMHSIHIYSSTAKLCEFCAHEYEKAKDMAAASLAYKCVEVAYLRVVYSSHGTASRDRNELQNALQIAPPGESPSSSASDVDNLNHQATADKVASTKVVGSPQVSGSHVISSRNRSSLLRVLNLAQDINLAMEASRKSRTAFTAATSRLGETMHKESMYSLKKALDFNFQDVEGLLRLVKIAMEAISR